MQGVIDDLTQENLDMASELLDWQMADIQTTRLRTIPFYYIDPNTTLQLSTVPVEGSPAIIKIKSVATFFYYIPEWHSSDFPITDFDVCILNVPLRSSIYTQNMLTCHTKTENQEIIPRTNEPPLFIPNLSEVACLEIYTNDQWMHSKIRIREGNNWRQISSERDNNWWWLETVPDIIPITS